MRKWANCIDMVWQSDEDDRLKQLAGTMPLPDLVALLNHEFGHLRPARSATAVNIRANRFGLLVEYLEGWTMQQFGQIVGWVDAHTETRRDSGNYGSLIQKYWIEPGLLKARKVRGRGRDGRWQILEADFEVFLREHPYAYDWRRFAPGPWRSKAELIARRNPWWTVDELRIRLGLQHRNFWEARWRQIPHQRRHHSLNGAHHSLGEPLIDPALFPVIHDMIAPNLHRYTRAWAEPKQHRAPRGWRRTCRYCKAVIIGQPTELPPPRCAVCGGSIRRTRDRPLIDDRRNHATREAPGPTHWGPWIGREATAS